MCHRLRAERWYAVPKGEVDTSDAPLARGFIGFKRFKGLWWRPAGAFIIHGAEGAKPCQLTADSGQLPLTSCEIVKKYIGYFFFPFSPRRKKGFHSYIDFLLSIGHGQEEGHDFLWYSPFYSFFLRNSSALTFS